MLVIKWMILPFCLHVNVPFFVVVQLDPGGSKIMWLTHGQVPKMHDGLNEGRLICLVKKYKNAYLTLSKQFWTFPIKRTLIH